MSHSLNVARDQKKPFHARQVTRLIGVSFIQSGWMGKDDLEEAMSLENIPAMLVQTPDGREFLIRVEEV